MNLKSIFSVVALSALMVGCSSDDLTNEPIPTEGPANGETISGYLNVNINLPTVSATGARALDQSNDQFDDGEPSEYAVNCAHLVVFDTDNEATATITSVKAFDDLKPWNTDASTTDNITSSAKSVIKIDAPQTSANLGVLVVLNDENASTHFPVGTTFKELFDAARILGDDILENSTGFMMTNAPLYDNGSAKTLVSINPNAIYNTRKEALMATPKDVFVERVVAKVNVTTTTDLQNSITIDTKNDTEITKKTYKATIVGWGLDITNKKSYPVRNVSDFATWKGLTNGTRFYSQTTGLNRIFWAIDPNYNGLGTDGTIDNNFNKITSVADATDLDAPAYILENTFDVSHMIRTQTTRAIIRATFAPDGADAKTFYTVGSSNTIYDINGMQTLVKQNAAQILEGKSDPTKYSFAPNTSVSGSAGEHSIQLGDVKYNDTNLNATEIEALNNQIGTIYTYKDGICYYVARIQHFGNKYTPWNPGDATYGNDDADGKYLGRYGVVRNNWYELQVSAIKHLGSPTIPTAPETPDDENQYYLTFKVNIHSWAKRVQNVIL